MAAKNDTSVMKLCRARRVAVWICVIIGLFSQQYSQGFAPAAQIKQTLSLLVKEDGLDEQKFVSLHRRDFISTLLIPMALISCSPSSTSAAIFNPFARNKQSSSLIVISPGTNATQPLQKGTFTPKITILSSELCLLKLLPIKNPFFRQLQSYIVSLSSLTTQREKSKDLVATTISELDKRRSQLEPVFNPDDDSLMQIRKGERGEQLIEVLRSRLVDILNATENNNEEMLKLQKSALLALSDVGELMVATYPYTVPKDDKFSYLPRLLGRAKVTFSFRRGRKQQLGNITIVADGYAAPITAGNFVDLCTRDFYTGLPIKFSKRRIGGDDNSAVYDVANLPILGSYKEGFYDPLTGKPRRIPLEAIRVEKGSKVPVLSYAMSTDTKATATTSGSTDGGNSNTLLSFDIPGLVAMNHPDRNINGASSEFFALQSNSLSSAKRKLLDGEYAPFGYIIKGMDVFDSLQPDDVIASTTVDEWGLLNLVKVRASSFSEVVQGSSNNGNKSSDKES